MRCSLSSECKIAIYTADFNTLNITCQTHCSSSQEEQLQASHGLSIIISQAVEARLSQLTTVATSIVLHIERPTGHIGVGGTY